jgi:hypothetical protein
LEELGLGLTWDRADESGARLFGLWIDSCSVIETVVVVDPEEVGEVASLAPILTMMIPAIVMMTGYL